MAMTRKSGPSQDDPEQSRRFIEAAKGIVTDESPEAFERAFGKVAQPKAGARKADSEKGS